MVTAWLVMFGPSPPGWWQWFTHPKFQHVMAIGWDHHGERWVVFDPRRRAMMVEVFVDSPKFHEWLGNVAHHCAPHVLRFAPRQDRGLFPPMFSCVGAVKALLGVNCSALSPKGLYRDLLARGAEIVEVPRPEADLEHLRHTGTAARGPVRCAAAPGAAAPGGRGPDQVDAGSTPGRDGAAPAPAH